MILISVIIPTHHRPTALRKCLETLKNQTLSLHLFEVIIIDNPAHFQNKSLVQEFPPQFIYLGIHESGVNLARNLGLESARGKIFFFLDDDCSIPGRDYLERRIRAHEKYSHFIGLGEKYLNPQKARFRCRFYNCMANAWVNLQKLPSGESCALLGGNSSYKREIFDHGFRFRQDLRYGGTETELHFRLRKAGIKLRLIEELAVEHHVSESWVAIFQRAWLQSLKKISTPEESRFLHKLHIVLKTIRAATKNPFERFAFIMHFAIYAMIGAIAFRCKRLQQKRSGNYTPLSFRTRPEVN